MIADQILVFAILAVALLLFAWGRLRYDLVALLALLAAVMLGVVPANEAFSGFSHPAVITVATILIMSRALRNSGVIESASRLLQKLSYNHNLQVFALCLTTAVCSAFMNNVGALALMLPIALQNAQESGRSPSQLLMPISFSSLLGGLITLIGTPPNIVIANYRAQESGEDFAMFDFTPVGLSLTVVGILFISLLGWRLLPKREKQDNQDNRPLLEIDDYITEVRLRETSPFVGKRLALLESAGRADISVVSLVRGGDRILAPSGFMKLQPNDILVVEADPDSLQHVISQAELELVGAAGLSADNLHSDRVGLSEVVIAPGSRMESRTARSLRLHTRYGVNLLGVARQGEKIRERLGQVRFMAGDVLLLQGEHEALPEALSALGCLPLAERKIELGPRTDNSWTTPAIFLISILLVVFGLLPPQISFAGAAVALVLFGELETRELYEAVDWSVIILLGAMIPVGLAMETTGGSLTLAQPLLSLGEIAPIWMIITLLMVLTMLLSDIMNNAATAVLMAPIGISIAKGLGANIDPFLMTVAIGASSTYLTPIGHQSNLLVMGPGGYRFSDYWRMGLPLNVLILLIGVPSILFFWPA